MSVIYFKCQKAFSYLLNNGEVYTIRTKQRRTGLAWVKHNKRKVADVWVEYVSEITDPVELERFVDKSGFGSVEEWLAEVRKLNRGRLPDRLFLYHVCCIEEAEKRYELTGIKAYKIIADRFREKIKEFERGKKR